MRIPGASTINTLDKQIHDNLLNEHTQKHTPVDTRFKWAPAAFLLACDAYGLKTRNNYKQHMVRIIAGEIMLNAAVRPLKKSMNRIRPNGDRNSFPSAHTGTGFLTSEIIYHELKENYPALKHTGYALSIVTGWLRMYHNKHWFSDVVGGALIGVLISKISGRLIDNLNRK
jgi:hypothetical protein